MTKPYLIQYSHFLYLCFIVSTLSGVLTQFIRVDGQPNFASIVIIVANILNIIFDYMFLSYFKMGMASVSLASFLGYAIGLALCLYYVHTPKRTFRFVKAALEIKSFIKSTWEIIKVGFPGASIGIFDVIFVYILNLFLASTLGNLGLTTYLLCVDALVIASIVNVGISETLTSIVPIYYAKHDYVNLNHLIRRALIIAIICGVALIAFLWIWPEGFLSLYNFDEIALSGFAINALKLYSFFFILTILPSMLIFYYEAIERSVLSTIFSVLSTLILPLVSIFVLYNMIGSNGIWLGFSVAL